jgi:hypothetical protein
MGFFCIDGFIFPVKVYNNSYGNGSFGSGDSDDEYGKEYAIQPFRI